MIALGGAIGTGLFHGSATSIGMAGPSIVLSYLIGGGVMVGIYVNFWSLGVPTWVSGSRLLLGVGSR